LYGFRRKLFYQDKDKDGLGNPNKSIISCTENTEYVGWAGDSDDNGNPISVSKKNQGEILWKSNDVFCDTLALGYKNVLLVSYFETNILDSQTGLFLTSLENSDWGRPFVSSDGTMYFYQEKKIRSYNSFGNEKWTTELSSQIITNLIIEKDGSIFVGTKEGLQKISSEGIVGEIYPVEINSNQMVSGFGGVYLRRGNELGNSLKLFDKSKKEFSWSIQTWGEPIAMGKDGSIYVSYGGSVSSISDVGKKSWNFLADEGKSGNIQGVAVDAKGILYVTDEFNIHALYSDGKKKWDIPRRTSETPVISEGVVYVSGIGIENGLYAHSTESGKHLWTLKSDSETNEPIQPKEIIVNGDGTVFFCDKESHRVYAVTANSLPETNPVWPMKFHDPQNTSNSDEK